MRLVRATKRLLEAKQNITPKLAERCLNLSAGSFPAPKNKPLVTARPVVFPDCAGTFNIHCAAPGIADEFTPSLQILPVENSLSQLDAEQLAEELLVSLKEHYGFTRMRIPPNLSGGYILYWSPHQHDRGAMYWFKFTKREPNRRAFGGIMLANMHRRR